MGYFDENEDKEKEGISVLAEGLSGKEEKAAEKQRLKEEKRLEKERRKKEKEARKRGEEPSDDEYELKSRITPEDTVTESPDQKKDGETAAAAAPATASDPGAVAGGEVPEEAPEGGKKKKRKRRRAEKPEEVNIVKDLLSLIIYIGIVVLACFLIVTYVGRRTTVHGDSMEPTLQSGDSLWINMLAYKFGDPKRYDIIVFPYQDDVNYIKRIIGLPGETVQITDAGDILINGKVLEEPKRFDRMRNNGIASSPITLGENEYFVLGDNRNNSRDSRWADVGLIKKDKIVGKAVFRLTPFKNFGSID